MKYLIALLIFLSHVSVELLAQTSSSVRVSPVFDSPGFADKAGKRIWKNESNQKLEGLTHWNESEGFASLGIGHFIWFPAGKEFGFKESFPDLVEYAKKNKTGTKIPQWLIQTKHCPWKTKKEFDDAKKSTQMKTLRNFLAETVGIQTEFIYERLCNAKQLMLDKTPKARKKEIGNKYELLFSYEEGLFAMLDYVNFKGEGTDPKEQHLGVRWGLLQVLERIPKTADVTNAHKHFAEASRATLENRVDNNLKLERFRAGWKNRCLRYAQDF